MIFLQGTEVIFKVALSLLGSHKPLILQHENLETIVDFIKNTLPNLGLVQMEKTINQVWSSPNLSKGLSDPGYVQAYYYYYFWAGPISYRFMFWAASGMMPGV